MTIKDLKKGDFFTLKPVDNPKESQVLIRGDYDKASKTYSCCYFDDMNRERFLKGSKVVYIDFTF